VDTIVTSAPIFCCVTSRNKALQMLRKKFPGVVMEINTGWAGETGIEIKAEKEKLQAIIGFIKRELSLVLVRFPCVN